MRTKLHTAGSFHFNRSRGSFRLLGGNRRFGAALFCQSGQRGIGRHVFFAFARQHGNRRIDLDALRATGDKDFPATLPSSTATSTSIGRLVGLNLGDGLAGTLMVSPSFFHASASTLPSVMVGDRAGIKICTGMDGIPNGISGCGTITNTLHRIDYMLRLYARASFSRFAA